MSSIDAAPKELRLPERAAAAARVLERLPWRDAGRIWLTTRLAFFGVAYAASWFLATGQGALSGGSLDIWNRWDASHFFLIADRGYTGPGSDVNGTAFFPLFPLLIRALRSVGMSDVVAGLVISACASLVAFIFLHVLAEADSGAGAGRRAVTYLAVFPTAVFLLAPYSEALFLAGAIPAFVLARRGRWLLAGVPAAVAVGARAAGMFLLVGLVAEFARQRDFTPARVRSALGGLALAFLPLVAYGAYLYSAKGSPLYFFTDQRLGWGRQLTDPITSFLNTWNTWQRADYPTNWIFAWRMEIVAAAVGVALTLWAVRKKEWGYAAYMGVTMLALVTSTWYFSIPRMLLSLFPGALFVAEATRGRPEWHDAAIMFMAPLAALGVVVFTHGAWFY